jgi:hypothetical protein
VRRFFQNWEWWRLQQNAPGLPLLRSYSGVRVDFLVGADRFVLVLRQPAPGAHLTFALRSPMSGVLVDGRTGAPLRPLVYSGAPGQPWDVPLPSESSLLLLGLREAPR